MERLALGAIIFIGFLVWIFIFATQAENLAHWIITGEMPAQSQPR